MNTTRKISLLSSKTFLHKTDLRQDRYLGIRKILKLSFFCYLTRYLLFCRPLFQAQKTFGYHEYRCLIPKSLFIQKLYPFIHIFKLQLCDRVIHTYLHLISTRIIRVALLRIERKISKSIKLLIFIN